MDVLGMLRISNQVSFTSSNAHGSLSTSEDKLQNQEQAVSLSVPAMVQMIGQSYRRSLEEFSESWVMSRCKSLSSSSSLSDAPQSIAEWLTLWEKDPVEILLDLGFGTEEPDVCTKIPPRFLSGVSVAKGINIRVFLEAQKQRMDIERPNLYERFRQLEVLDHVTSALSSLLTDVNTQETKAQDTGRDEASLDVAKSRPVVTRVKRRRIGQLLKRASRQTVLLQQGSLAPGEATLSSRKEQPTSSADIDDRTVQVGFSARVTLGCLTQEESNKGALAYPMSSCPPAPSVKAWASSHLHAKQPHLSPVYDLPAKDGPRKEPPLLLAHTLQKVADLSCKLPDSFEMEEIQSFEDETLCGNAPDITSAEAMVTRTSSCQSDSSGFMEELPEPVVLQNASLSGTINIISDTHNQETVLSHRTVFPMLSEDFHQKPDDCVAEVSVTACKNILTVPRPMKPCSDQEEEACLLLTAENGKYQACDAEPQSFVQDMLCDMDKKEDKAERKQLEKESTGHKEANVTFTELSDKPPAVISESKIRGEDEGERCWTAEDIGVACGGSAHGGRTGRVKAPWWGVEVVSEGRTPLLVNEMTNRQKFCKMGGDSKNTRWSPKMGLPENRRWGSAAPSGSSEALNCSLPVSWRHRSCLVEGPVLSSSEDQKTGSMGEMLGANKSEQGDAVQNSEMVSAPLKSVTVQMSSGLELTSRAKVTGNNAPLSETFAREDPVDFSNVLAHSSERGPLTQSDPGASKASVKQTTKASSQTDIPTREPGQPPLLYPPPTNLTKSASLDSVLCGKDSSHCWGVASGTGGVQDSHCCHCCCCHGCCPWAFPRAVSPQCCSLNHPTAELQLLTRLMLLQDPPMCNLALCTLHEIEAMKCSCQHFQDKLDEIEQHLTEQQELFSRAMPDEGREEGRYLQLLQRAIRQEAAELEFQLNDQACQVRKSILRQLEQLLAEQSHLFSELGLSDWKGERKALNKQVFPDDADTDPQSGCSKMVLQKAPSGNRRAASSLSALKPEVSPVQFPTRTTSEFPTRTTSEMNSVMFALQQLSTSKKEIKGPPQANMDFKAFVHDLKKSFQNSLGNDSAEGKD